MKHQLLLVYAVLVTAILVFILFQRPEMTFEYREDVAVIFPQEAVETLNARYPSPGPEELYCLHGEQQGNRIVITHISEEKLVYQDYGMIVYENDPPCQYPSAVGSLHTHPASYGCTPSTDDYFTFGEMKDPEPLINAIQCGINEFYIFRMPGKQEAYDFRLLRWSVE
jgi:hypothetical protein